MKTLILSVLFIIGISANAQTQVSEQVATPARAQDPNPSQIIIKAVPSFGTLNGIKPSPYSTSGMLFGIGLGAAVDLSLGNVLSAELGVEWARRGWEKNFNPSASEDSLIGQEYQSIRLNYLVIPALFKAKFGNIESTRLFVGAGPYVGFFLSGAETSKSPFSQTETIETYKGSDVGTDFGFRTSLGVEIPASSSLGIIVGGQYDFGLANIAEKSEDSILTVNTASLLLNAGLAIRL